MFNANGSFCLCVCLKDISQQFALLLEGVFVEGLLYGNPINLIQFSENLFHLESKPKTKFLKL